MKTGGICFAFLLTLFGCIKGKKVSLVEISAKTQEADEVKKVCVALRELGDIRDHISLIEYNHKKILYYLDQKDPFEFEQRITDLAEEIREASSKVEALVSPEWTKEMYKIIYHWRINRHDFKPSLGAYSRRGFKIKDSMTMNAYFNGEKRDDFLKFVSSKWERNNATITLSKRSSYLDLCLLNETIILFHEFKVKGATKVKSKYFNLYLTEGDLLKF